jgi:hypothetical protein
MISYKTTVGLYPLCKKINDFDYFPSHLLADNSDPITKDLKKTFQDISIVSKFTNYYGCSILDINKNLGKLLFIRSSRTCDQMIYLKFFKKRNNLRQNKSKQSFPF